MAIIMPYFGEFGSFRGQLRESGWLAINRFSPDNVMKYTNYKHDGRAVLFAVAELLVVSCCSSVSVVRNSVLT